MLDGTTLDIALHIVTLLVASSLVAVSYMAYVKKQNEKFFYVCVAFAVFCIKEILITINTIYGTSPIVSAMVHVLNLLILTLFFRGTVK